MKATGFPTNARHPFSSHPWNLHNVGSRYPSLLSFLPEPISSVTTPSLFISQMFTTACWRLEDHSLYSFNFLHVGQPRTWYAIPGDQRPLYERVFQKLLPHLAQEDPNLINSMVTMLNPQLLRQNGLTVYEFEQKAGEFVITFPQSTYCFFSHGV
jgi:histone demethylase JARID1